MFLKDWIHDEPILSLREEISETALLHLQNGVLDRNELVPDLHVIDSGVGKGGKHIQGFVFSLLEDQPSRRLG